MCVFSKVMDIQFGMIRRSLAFTSDLHFEFCDSPLQAKELLLKSSLFPFQGCYLLLDAAVFCLLKIKMPFPKLMKLIHFFLYPDELVGETLLDVCCFHRQH